MKTRNSQVPNSTKKLRFGVMCQGHTLCLWQARCIQYLLELDELELALLIIDERSHVRRGNFLAKMQDRVKRFVEKLKKVRLGNLLFDAFNQFVAPPETKKAVAIEEVLGEDPSVDEITCDVHREGEFSEYFSEHDIGEIEKYDLDFILRFGFGIIRGEILQVPQYGVWSFHHDDEQKYRGAPPCFWEIYKGDDVTGAILQRITNRLDGGIVLRKGYFPTIRHSYPQNLSQALLGSAKWPRQVCVDLLNGKADYLHDPSTNTDASIFYKPSNLQMLMFVAKTWWNWLRLWYDALLTDHWNIGVLEQPIHQLLVPECTPEVKWIDETDGSQFRADPFGVEENGNLFVAFEEYSYKAGKGVISGVLMSGDEVCETRPFLDPPFHVAYPYLIAVDGDVYCIPETFEANEIGLYRLERFPWEWSKVGTLIAGGMFVDPTCVHYDDRWWLFCTQREKRGHSLRRTQNVDLFVYYADKLMGPWESHCNNPVKTDVRTARPAGTPFVHEGVLYRPAQDCSSEYGSSIVINKVLALTPDEFHERTVARISPVPPYTNGAHTISAVGDKTLIDGKRRVLNSGDVVRKAKEQLASLFHRRSTRARECR